MPEPAMIRLQEVVDLDLPDRELAEELAAFAEIAAAIRKLRTLDLTEVHPAVIYNPVLAYPEEPP